MTPSHDHVITSIPKQIDNLPYEIIRAKFTLPSMLAEAHFQLVVFIHRIHSQPQDMICRQDFEASQSLYESKDTSSWYNIVVSWLLANGLDINNLPPFRYNHENDKTLSSHEDNNKVICKKYGKFTLNINGSTH